MRQRRSLWSALVFSFPMLFGALLAAGCESDDADPDAGASAGARIYASIAGDDEVVVIDEESQEVISTIPVGMGPAILLATPDHQKLYTANWKDDSISAIDVATEDVTRISVSARPYVIAMAPQGDYLYAGLNDSQIAVIDTQDDSIERHIATPELPASLIVSADGKTLYVATLGGTLRAVSVETGEVTQPAIRVGLVPAWITISPDGSKVFTLNFLSDNVSVVDTASWKVVATVPAGAGSQAIIANVTPDNATLWVTNHGTSELIAIDTDSHTLTQTIELTGRPVGVSLNGDGSRVYVTDFGPDSLDVPADAMYLLTGNLTATGHGQVSVFDTESGEQIGQTISVGAGATSVVVLP